MKVYLVRHGSANHPFIDSEMGLSDQGKNEADIVATNLCNEKINITKIYHSKLLRAKETAEILSSFLKPQEGTEEVDNLLPDDDINIWARKIEKAEEDIMLVGHMPYMPALTDLLTKKVNCDLTFVNVCTVCLEKAASSWIIKWVKTPTSL